MYQKAMETAVRRAIHHDEAKERKRAKKAARGLPSNAPTPPTGLATPVEGEVIADVEMSAPKERKSRLARIFGGKKESSDKIRPGWRDINPFPTMLSIFRRPTNAVVLGASGILFAAQYTVVYTAAITLAREPYAYNALHIGLVLLSFGVGSMAGSLGGGKYSDVVLRRMKEANGGKSVPEVSLVW